MLPGFPYISHITHRFSITCGAFLSWLSVPRTSLQDLEHLSGQFLLLQQELKAARFALYDMYIVYIYIYIKGNHPQMALFQGSELL